MSLTAISLHCEEDEFIHAFFWCKIGRHDTINMGMHVSDMPQVLAISFILSLAHPQKAHPGAVTKTSILLFMDGLNCAPEGPGALVFIPMEKFEVEVDD